MILCIQSLFGTGSIVLCDETGREIDVYEWDTRNDRVALTVKISEMMERACIGADDISGVCAVQGPGPFTSVRTVSVIAQTWKSEMEHVKLYAVPTGIFLAHTFAGADHLLLSAGKTAFFCFDAEDPREFEKCSMSRISEFSGTYGGYFLNSENVSAHVQKIEGISNSDVFGALLRKRDSFETDHFLPEYGADPNIGK